MKVANGRTDWYKVSGDLITELNALMHKRGIIGEDERFWLSEIPLVGAVGSEWCLKLERGHGRHAEMVRSSPRISTDHVRAVLWLQGYVAACYHLLGDTAGHEFLRPNAKVGE
jgi:hypothetical protein